MITHTIDVESFLGQYDPGMILVGPLLSLSMSSSYRYFYVAGNGSKVYETISLGFVEVETKRTDAARRFHREIGKPFRGSVDLWQSPGDGTRGPYALAK